MTEAYKVRHGRDGELNVWQLHAADETSFSKVLPIDDAELKRKAPWLLHSLKVHALNFCSFAVTQWQGGSDRLIAAIPGLQDGSIHLTGLPSEQRVATIPPPKDIKTGMLMAVGLSCRDSKHFPIVMAGYESGHVAVWQKAFDSSTWQAVYVEKAHTQPIMSLGVAQELQCFFTSSADAIIARHALHDQQITMETFQTKHAGQQSLAVRSDEKIIATAGWDGKMRVYSAKTVKELAVLKWHKEGCYACAFAEVLKSADVVATTVAEKRLRATIDTHWIAAGSKDGKISLWQIY